MGVGGGGGGGVGGSEEPLPATATASSGYVEMTPPPANFPSVTAPAGTVVAPTQIMTKPSKNRVHVCSSTHSV